jgi:COP9 signalosome complex subunit 1
MHLSRHVYAITSEIRKRAADLYFQPFASVQLEKMGAAFGVSVTEMERMAVELIQEGRIKARVDSTNKVSASILVFNAFTHLKDLLTGADCETNRTSN